MGMSTPALQGVNLTRTLAPVVPANFLSRRHLFNLFEDNIPGATVIAAPAGYGKTMMAAEWALAQERPTIWLSVDAQDSPQMFFSHIVQAVRNVIPTFGADFESERFKSPQSYIDFLTREAAKVSGSFNFIIDNGSSDAEEIAPFAQSLIDNLPNNVHVVIIRRVTPATSLAKFASLGNLSLITSQDLKFSESEIMRICELNSIDMTDAKNSKHIDKCIGWPAAVQLMARNISRGIIDSSFEISGSTNPLGILALESFNSFSPENRHKLLKLGIVDDFDLEVASIILGEDFSESYLNKLATDGLFINVSSGIQRNYTINPIIFEVMQELRNPLSPEDLIIHKKLADYFMSVGQPAKALEHLFLSGNKEQITEVLRVSIRDMAIIGRGDQIIRWSQYGSDDSAIGEIMNKAIQIVGYLVNLEFSTAEALAAELDFMASQSSDLEFITQITAMVISHIYFARGDFERATRMIDKALGHDYNIAGIENVDKIALLRLRADIAYLHDDVETISAALHDARNLQNDVNASISAFHIGCITSMDLWSQGRFFEAAEFASIAINQANKNNYSGIAAPFDALLVITRCQLELSQLTKSVEIANLASQKAEMAQIWPWYFMYIGTSSRIHITQGHIHQIADLIVEQRSKLKLLPIPNQLSWIIDMTEVFLRFVLSDWKRAEELLKRMPKIEMVRQIDMNVQFEADPKRVHELVANMPEKTPREKINKFLYLATINIDKENTALKYLREALDLGAEVGFHEYFVRQNRLYSHMVKAAAAKPTIFIESVVREMSTRNQKSLMDSGPLDEKLTNREVEILKHLTTGNPVNVIGKQLHISQNTMKTHLRNIYRKLQVDNRHSAVEKAQKLLLI